MDEMENEMIGHEVLLVDDRHDVPTRTSRSLFSNSIHAKKYLSSRSEVRENGLNAMPTPIPLHDQAKAQHQNPNLVLITPTDHIEEAELIIRYAKHLVRDASQKHLDKRTKKEALKVAQNFTQEARTRALHRQAPSISLLSSRSCKTHDSDKSKLLQFHIDRNDKNLGKKRNKEDNSSSISELCEGRNNTSEKNMLICASKPRGKNGVNAVAHTKLPFESGKNAKPSSNQEAHPKSKELYLGRSRSSPWNLEQASLDEHKFVIENASTIQQSSNTETKLHQCSSDETKKVTHMRKRLPRRAAAQHILRAHTLDRVSENDDGQSQNGSRSNQGNRKYKTLLSQQPVLKTRSDLSVTSNSSEQRLAYIWGSKFNDGMLMSSSDEDSDSSDDDGYRPIIADRNF